MGCVNSVKSLVSALPGIGQIDIDLSSGTVTLQHDPGLASEAAIHIAISEGGYEVS
jgi:copper chaperone CopZ